MYKTWSRRCAAALAYILLASTAIAQVQPGQSPQSVAKGGTGATTFDAHALIFGNGTSPLKTYLCGANLFMIGGGATADPFCRALIGADLPNPTATTFGGIFASAPVVGQYISGITPEGKVQRDLQGRFYATSGGGSVTVEAQPGGGQKLWLPSMGAEDYLISRASTDTLTNKTIDASQLVTNTVANAKLAQMAAGTIKGNNTGSTANAADLTVAQTLSLLNNPMLQFGAAVDFNAVGDTAVAIPLPAGVSYYRISGIYVINTGATASLTTAQCGVFTAAAGGGTAIVASGSALSGITSNAALTSASALQLTQALSSYYVSSATTSLYFRVTQAQGAAASGRVLIQIQPVP